MMHAQCQCGQLRAEVSGDTDQIVACHCADCQRRSGSPFGVIAYYSTDQVRVTGKSKEYTRSADTGRLFTTGFCPECGSTVWCRGELKPGVLGIPVGNFFDPDYPPPVRSVWERSRHGWAGMPDGIQHFPKGRS